MTFNVGIIGLGYVGLPLCLAVSKKHKTKGYDINHKLVEDLKNNKDNFGIVKEEALIEFEGEFSDDPSSLKDCNFFIVTVPTPVDEQNKPDLTAIESATRQIAMMLTKGAIVCYESTVYPGTTEEICVPILEEVSKLNFNADFFVGYSPERMNPGDALHTVENIVKVTSGSTEAAASIIDEFYRNILNVSTFKATSIMVAEASKILENAQRDVNIAFMNEMAVFFDKIGIKTVEVLAAAKTKWNFLDFKPGLVGGHCISVDPYYLVSRAEQINHKLQIVKASREVNESIPKVISNKVQQQLLDVHSSIDNLKVLILGLAFKENVKDTRNSKVMDIANDLNKKGLVVDIYDPVVGIDLVVPNSNIAIISRFPSDKMFHVVIAAVSHEEIKAIDISEIKKIMYDQPVVIDVKGIWPTEEVTFRL